MTTAQDMYEHEWNANLWTRQCILENHDGGQVRDLFCPSRHDVFELWRLSQLDFPAKITH